MLSYAELEQFYEGLVIKLREQGVVCAITSGMACVHYGVAETTKDCDATCSVTPLLLGRSLICWRKRTYPANPANIAATSARRSTRASIAADGRATFSGTRNRIS